MWQAMWLVIKVLGGLVIVLDNRNTQPGILSETVRGIDS